MSGSLDPLNVRLLVTGVQKISDWYMLGVHLGVPNEELNKIDRQFSSHGVERCKAELFDLWLRRNPSARWDDVTSALEQLNEMTLANELRALCRVSGAYHTSGGTSSTGSALTVSSPPCEGNEQKPVQEPVRVKVSKSTVRQFAKLESKFASLVCNVKSMAESKGILPGKLHSFLEVRLSQEIQFCTSTSVSDLFKSITPYYCFLNTTLLENIIDEFLGEPLKQQLDEYEGLLEEFTSSTKISLLKEIDLKPARQKGIPLVVLKLAGHCLDVTIKRFQELIDCIFEEKSNVLSNIQVKDGCICITWTTRTSSVSSLTALANKEITFMEHVGVLRLTIGEVTVFERPGSTKEWEEDNSSLEDHLLQSLNSGCTKAVNFLLKAGADPNHQNANGISCLFIASASCSSKIVKLLIDAGADVNVLMHSQNGQTTSLITACRKSHTDIVRMLLQSGADPNLQTNTGQTALLSVDYNHSNSFGIVKSLLKAGAAVNIQDSDGWSSLTLACEHGCYKIAELLIEYGADVQLRTYDKYTPLMIACHYGYEDITGLILGSNADPNLLNDDDNSALMMACHQQLAQAVSLLLSSGADPNLQNNMGWTALMFSCILTEHDFDNCIPALLVSKNANPNLQTSEGYTALMLAARHDYISGVNILLEAKAQVNEQDQHGRTALHRSAYFGNLTTTELLLSAGADSSLVDSKGKTPIVVALDSQQHELCQLLLSYTGTKSDTGKEDPSHQIIPIQADSASSSTISSHQELEQLRMAVYHPLPPQGTIKHDHDQPQEDTDIIAPQ